MAFNIADFRANGLIYGGARPNQFEVLVTPPPGIGTNSKTRLKFLIKAAALPVMQLDKVEVPYMGSRVVNEVGDRTFGDWTITVMNDADFAARSMFEAWSNKMNALVSNRMSDDVFPHGYKQDLQVRQFAMEGSVAREYTLSGAFPIVVAPIPLSYEAKSRIEEFDVTFAFDWFTPNDNVSLVGGNDPLSDGLLNPSSID